MPLRQMWLKIHENCCKAAKSGQIQGFISTHSLAETYSVISAIALLLMQQALKVRHNAVSPYPMPNFQDI
ncbi:hypothetical protein [Nostoc sp.]